MYWPERPERYIGSFKTCIGKYDVYVYKDIWLGLLLQDGPEDYEYACMDLNTIKRLLKNGAYSVEKKYGVVPIKYGIAYTMYKKYLERNSNGKAECIS